MAKTPNYMNREQAIAYLKKKGKFEGKPEINGRYDVAREEQIELVKKEGKIYGDPIANVQW